MHFFWKTWRRYISQQWNSKNPRCPRDGATQLSQVQVKIRNLHRGDTGIGVFDAQGGGQGGFSLGTWKKTLEPKFDQGSFSVKNMKRNINWIYERFDLNSSNSKFKRWLEDILRWINYYQHVRIDYFC